MNSSHPTIIVDEGFTGLFTALHLRHQHNLRSIVLIDPQERFVFKPMLYELLTSELSEDTVCATYEELRRCCMIEIHDKANLERLRD